MQHEYSTGDVAETERTSARYASNSLSAINVETRNHAESQNQRLVKTRGRWRHRRERPPKTLEIVRATHGSVELVPLRNVHVQEKLTCLHVITENLHPYNPIWGQCKALHHVVAIYPHFAEPCYRFKIEPYQKWLVLRYRLRTRSAPRQIV